nr:uncharacterized protein LOC105875546 [Microcebus murinus]
MSVAITLVTCSSPAHCSPRTPADTPSPKQNCRKCSHPPFGLELSWILHPFRTEVFSETSKQSPVFPNGFCLQLSTARNPKVKKFKLKNVKDHLPKVTWAGRNWPRGISWLAATGTRNNSFEILSALKSYWGLEEVTYFTNKTRKNRLYNAPGDSKMNEKFLPSRSLASVGGNHETKHELIIERPRWPGQRPAGVSSDHPSTPAVLIASTGSLCSESRDPGWALFWL